jgi:hypothetical protein
MKKMKNVDVVRYFVERKGNAQNYGETLRIEGNKLVNYSTTIAQFTKYGLTLNDTNYSNTTSKIQSYLRSELFGERYFTVSNLKMGIWDLTPYVEKLLKDVRESNSNLQKI